MGATSERLVLDMIRAVEDRNPERLLEIYHPDVEFLWPPELPYGGTYRGTAVRGMSEAFATAWEPVQPTAKTRRFDPRVLASSDDEVVVLYHQRGENRNGDVCETEVIGLYTVVGDHVTRLQMFYFDPAKIADFLREAVASDVPDESAP